MTERQHRHGGPGPFYPRCPVCNGFDPADVEVERDRFVPKLWARLALAGGALLLVLAAVAVMVLL